MTVSGVHTVLVFQQVRGVEAVLAAGAGHKAVIAAVIFAVFIAQLTQLFFAQGPVDMPLALLWQAWQASQTPSPDDHRFLDGVDRVRQTHSRSWASGCS